MVPLKHMRLRVIQYNVNGIISIKKREKSKMREQPTFSLKPANTVDKDNIIITRTNDKPILNTLEKTHSAKNAFDQKWARIVNSYLKDKKVPENDKEVQMVLKGYCIDSKKRPSNITDVEELLYLYAIDSERPYHEDISTSSNEFFSDMNAQEKLDLLNDPQLLNKKMKNIAMKIVHKKSRQKYVLSKGPKPAKILANTIFQKLSARKHRELIFLKYYTSLLCTLGDHTIIYDMRFRQAEDTKKNHAVVCELQKATSNNFYKNYCFNVMLTNCNVENYPTLQKNDSSLNLCHISNQSYHSLTNAAQIRKEDLILVSSDVSNELMLEYEAGKSYILIGMNPQEQILKQKAIQGTYNVDGITMLKLPILVYLKWSHSTVHYLRPSIMFLIIKTLKETGDWLLAFQHIPIERHLGLTEYGKQVAGNRKDILEWYETAERKTLQNFHLQGALDHGKSFKKYFHKF